MNTENTITTIDDSDELHEKYAIYYKGKVFDTLDSKEEAQDQLDGMDLSDDEKKEYKIKKTNKKAKGWSMNEEQDLVSSLVTAARNKDYVAAKEAFGTLIAQKSLAKIAERKIDVAKNIYNP